MKKLLFLLITAIQISAQGQQRPDDTPGHIDFRDRSGKVAQALVVHPPQILIVEGDSIYTILDESQIRRTLEKKEGFDIINNPDSVQKFIMERIKSIIIIKSKEQDE